MSPFSALALALVLGCAVALPSPSLLNMKYGQISKTAPYDVMVQTRAEGLAQVEAVKNQVMGSMNQVMGSQRASLRDANGCANAIMSLFSSMSGACDANTVYGFFGAATDAGVAAYCTAPCYAQLQNLTNVINAQCASPSDWPTYIDTATMKAVTSIGGYLNIPCVKSTTGAYCLPRILNVVNVAQSNPANISQATMAAVCNPLNDCADSIADAVVQYATPDIAAALAWGALTCLNNNGDYCYPRYLNLGTAMQQVDFANINSPSSVAGLDATCHVCTRMIVDAMVIMTTLGNPDPDAEATNAALKTFGKYIDVTCVRLPNNGQYCLQAINAIMNSNMKTCAALDNPNTIQLSTPCPADCQANMKSISDTLGCCFETLIGMAAMGSDSTSAIVLKQWTNKQCAVVTQSSCSDSAVDGTWVIDALSPSFVSNSSNLALLAKAVSKDIENNAGLGLDIDMPVSNLVVSYENTLMGDNQLQGPNGARVTINFRATPLQGSDAAAAQAKMNRRTTAGKTGLSTTNNAIGVRGRVGAAATVNSGMSSQKVSSVTVQTPKKTSSASRVAASAVALVAIVIALLF